MLRYNGVVKLGFGEINDDKTIAYLGEFDGKNAALCYEIPFVSYTDPDNGYTVYEYNKNLYTFKELRLEYLKGYYNVE